MKPKELLLLIQETDKLKAVNRRAYIGDTSRNENSAEHSWHLCIALMALRPVTPPDLNLMHAIEIALVHDICEIGAGDISIYDKNRNEKTVEEASYMVLFEQRYGQFGKHTKALWDEYEAQETQESKWVKMVDRLLPFLMNIMTHGKTWEEQGIRKDQVIAINGPIAEVAPELFEWILEEVDMAVERGWLKLAQQTGAPDAFSAG